MTKDRRLGRGLAALLGTPQDDAGTAGDVRRHVEDGHPHSPDTAGSEAAPGGSAVETAYTVPLPGVGDPGLIQLDVHQIDDNPFQPRRHFEDSEIASLAESLKQHDMLQPVLVRRVGPRFQLISGERRWRAAKLAGWSTIPACVRDADDRLVAELAIVENLQRKDLDPIEKAMSFKRYLDHHNETQEDLAQRLRIDRSTIANLVRLLELPEPVREALQAGHITAGHARALLPLGDEPEQIRFAARIHAEGLSVRATEQMVQETIDEQDSEPLSIATAGKKAKRRSKSRQTSSLEQELRMALGTKVEIRESGKGRGKIVVHFSGHDEFERLRTLLCDAGGADLRSEAG